MTLISEPIKFAEVLHLHRGAFYEKKINGTDTGGIAYGSGSLRLHGGQ